jgi:hypothetical protein
LTSSRIQTSTHPSSHPTNSTTMMTRPAEFFIFCSLFVFLRKTTATNAA